MCPTPTCTHRFGATLEAVDLSWGGSRITDAAVAALARCPRLHSAGLAGGCMQAVEFSRGAVVLWPLNSPALRALSNAPLAPPPPPMRSRHGSHDRGRAGAAAGSRRARCRGGSAKRREQRRRRRAAVPPGCEQLQGAGETGPPGGHARHAAPACGAGAGLKTSLRSVMLESNVRPLPTLSAHAAAAVAWQSSSPRGRHLSLQQADQRILYRRGGSVRNGKSSGWRGKSTAGPSCSARC